MAAAKPIKAALIDISGTLHVGKDAVPGAAEACRKILQQRSDRLRVLFLTNTSKMSSGTLLRQLREMGFDETAVPAKGIMTGVRATRRYILQNKLRPYCLVEDDLLKSDFVGVDFQNPNCVLVGLAPSKFNYENLNDAFRILTRSRGCDDVCLDESSSDADESPQLVAIHRAVHYRDSDHELSLGPGGFVSLLEHSAGVTARIIGKPSRDFYRAALSSLGVDDPSHAVMVGDDVVGDIQGALDAGIGTAILVRTGKYVHGDESGERTKGIMPTLTVDSIVDAVDYICSTLD